MWFLLWVFGLSFGFLGPAVVRARFMLVWPCGPPSRGRIRNFIVCLLRARQKFGPRIVINDFVRGLCARLNYLFGQTQADVIGEVMSHSLTNTDRHDKRR